MQRIPIVLNFRLLQNYSSGLSSYYATSLGIADNWVPSRVTSRKSIQCNRMVIASSWIWCDSDQHNSSSTLISFHFQFHRVPTNSHKMAVWTIRHLRQEYYVRSFIQIERLILLFCEYFDLHCRPIVVPLCMIQDTLQNSHFSPYEKVCTFHISF